MFIGTWLFTFHSSVGAQCVSTSHFAPELGLVDDRYSYKHSAPTELTAFGCGPAALCLRGELPPAIKLTTETCISLSISEYDGPQGTQQPRLVQL